MVSGTPVLTTNLPGMPQEYYPYVYLIENESTEGLAKAFKQVLELPGVDLKKKGYEAREFVLSKKNSVL